MSEKGYKFSIEFIRKSFNIFFFNNYNTTICDIIKQESSDIVPVDSNSLKP